MNLEKSNKNVVNEGNSMESQGKNSTDAKISRRRFAKASVAGAGVLATMASQPVLGRVLAKPPSGFASAT